MVRTSILSNLSFGLARLCWELPPRPVWGLLEKCRELGIVHYDVAPSYGSGTAESLLGSVFCADTEVKLTTKVGLLRPKYPYVRAIARQLKRATRHGFPSHERVYPPILEPPGNLSSNFGQEFILRSVDASLKRLRRSKLATILLHEAYATNFSDAAVSCLQGLLESGVAKSIGYSHGGVFQVTTDCLFPHHFVAQVAVTPEQLGDGSLSRNADRAIAFHSIVKAGLFRCTQDAEFAKACNLVALEISSGGFQRRTALAVVFYLLLHKYEPNSKLIFATSSRSSVTEFITALLEHENGDIFERFARCLDPVRS